MPQFFEAHRGAKKVSPLVTQLPWTQHLIILSQTKHQQERELYLLLEALRWRVDYTVSPNTRRQHTRACVSSIGQFGIAKSTGTCLLRQPTTG